MFKLEPIFSKCMSLKRINCLSCVALQINSPTTNVNLIHNRKFRLSSNLFSTKKYKGIENEYMFQFISKNGLYFPVSSEIEQVETREEFENLLNKDYRQNGNATTILRTFKALEKFCRSHNIDISYPKFDNLVDGLMDHCRNLTDEEVLELLHVLARYPKCESYRDHNYHDVWSCLDDISCERLANRDTTFLLEMAEAWYQLDLGKIGEFIFTSIDFLAKRSKQLTKDEVIKTFFYMNVCRRKSVPVGLEIAVEKYLKTFTIDELGIIALGYFKSKSKIKFNSIMLAMMIALKKDCATVNQITLSAILKALRFSKVGPLIKDLDEMLDILTEQIDRLSIPSCLHIAIIGSGMIHYHEKSMVKAIQKIISSIENVEEVRLKDIERILIASTMVDYRPKVSPDLFEASFKEIHEERRISELTLFPRLLPCILGCLSMVNMYSHKLMDRVLDTDYIFNTYGKNIGSISREIFSLDSCIQIECPNYKGKRLSPNMKYRLVKWIIEYIPSRNQEHKITVYDQLFLDVEENLILLLGDEDKVKVDYVVPHFGRADIILCKDKTTDKFIEPPAFQRYILGDQKYALDDPNLTWYALSVIGWNNTVRNTSKPVGMVAMKQRHLNKLGYNSKLIIWNQYMNLSKENKLNYIKSLLR